MKEWFNAADLAELDLPDVPGTKSAVIRFAKRMDWRGRRNLAGAPLARKRKGRGGGWEYHYTVLPMAAQSRLVAQHAKRRLAVTDAPESPDRTVRGETVSDAWEWYDGLPHNRKVKAEKRLAALDAVRQLKRGGLQVNIAVNEVARLHGVAASTIYAWQDLCAGLDRADWLPALAPRHAGRTKKVTCDPRAWEFVKRHYLTQSKPPFETCYEELKRAAGTNGWTIPSSRTLYRRIAEEIPRAIRVYWREGPTAMGRLYPHQERDRTMFHALEAVNADGHKWDIFVRWPDGSIGRPIMLAIQDLYSNKMLAWRIDKSENADLVRLAFKDVFEQHGIPDLAFLDNGRGFAAKAITGQQPNRYRFKVKPEEPSGILTSLGVEVRWTRPYSGQSKPIERAFKELCERIAMRPEFEGAYTGNKPDAKPENYGSKAVPLDDFLRIVGEHVALYNAKPGRNTRVCRRVMSFDEAYRNSLESLSLPPRKASPEQLRMLLLAAESVRADRQSGSLRLLDNRYWAEPLVELAGTALTVRFDPDDLHGGVDVYRQDGRYVCRADCLEAAGFANAEQARELARKRNAWRKHNKKMAEIERSMTLKQWMNELPEVDDPDPADPKAVRLVTGGVKGNTTLAHSSAPDPAPDPDAMSDEEYDRHYSAGLVAIQGGRED